MLYVNKVNAKNKTNIFINYEFKKINNYVKSNEV